MLTMFQRMRGAMPKWQPAYEQLVLDVADGKPLPENLEERLTGRPPEKFQADVKLLVSRREAERTLNSSAELKAEADAAAKAVEEAKQALANDPFAKMAAEYERKKTAVYDAQLAANAARAAYTDPQSQARHLLFTTSSKRIDSELAELSGELATLQRSRDQVALSSAEVSERAAAENEVATLPSKIAQADVIEAAGLTARLVSMRTTLKSFAARQKEADRITREMDKLSRSREKIEAKRMVPENMEFTSQPKHHDFGTSGELY